MAKEPINTSNVTAPAPTPTVAPTPTPTATPVQSAPRVRTSKPNTTADRFPGGENVQTSNNKFNMAQLQKFEYFSAKNIVPNKDLKNSQDWKAYESFCKAPNEEKETYAKEYSTWKKDQETKEDMILFHNGGHAEAYAEGKFNDYEDSKTKYEKLLVELNNEERTAIVNQWKEELNHKEPIEISETDQEQTHDNKTPQKSEKTLSAEDQYKELQEKSKFGILLPDDQARLEVLEKEIEKGKGKENDDGDTPTISNYKNPEHDPEELKNGPFKEGDIIDYMYNDWLIGGANWLYVKSDKYARKYGNMYYDRLVNGASNKGSKDEKNAETTKTKDFAADTDLKLAKNLEKIHENIDKNMKREINRLQMIVNGNYDDAKISDEFRKQLEEGKKKFGKDHIKKFCEAAQMKLTEMSEDYKCIQNISSAIVSTELNMEKINDVKVKKKSKKVIAASQAKVAENLARRLNEIALEGGNPQEFLRNISEKTDAAHKFSTKQIEDGNTNEKGKTEIKNDALKEVLDEIEKKSEKEYEPNTLIETLKGNLNQDALTAGLKKKNEEQQAYVDWRAENNVDRRDRIKQLKEKFAAEGKDFGGRIDTLEMTRHSDGSQKTSSVVLVDRLVESKNKDKASGKKEQSDDTKIIIQELNKNKSK